MAAFDFVYAPHIRHSDDYGKSVNTLSLDLVNDGDVIYTHTMYVKLLFSLIRHLFKEVSVVTHNSDINVGEAYKIPSNVLNWFTTNVNTKDERIQSIPIGLENDHWHPLAFKKEKMVALLEKPKDLKGLLYMCHSIRTNADKRSFIYQIFKDKPWCTSQGGAHAVPFGEYLDNVYNHHFVICPEGNGIDTHRTWEALYMGTIPIEKMNINNQFYTDLPICFVNDWEEVTVDFLNKEYVRINTTDWNMKKLTFEYWKNKIQKHE